MSHEYTSFKSTFLFISYRINFYVTQYSSFITFSAYFDKQFEHNYTNSKVAETFLFPIYIFIKRAT